MPNNRRPRFEPHDAQTKALIAQQDRLYQLPHGINLIERLSHWRYMDKMRGPEEKQRYIEQAKRYSRQATTYARQTASRAPLPKRRR